MEKTTVETKEMEVIGGNYLYGFDKLEKSRLENLSKEVEQVLSDNTFILAPNISKILILLGISKTIVNNDPKLKEAFENKEFLPKEVREEIYNSLPESNPIPYDEKTAGKDFEEELVKIMFSEEIFGKVTHIIVEKHKDKYTSKMIKQLKEDLKVIHEAAKLEMEQALNETENKPEENNNQPDKPDLNNPLNDFTQSEQFKTNSPIIDTNFFTANELPLDPEEIKRKTAEEFEKHNKELISKFPMLKAIDDVIKSITDLSISYKAVEMDGLVKINVMENQHTAPTRDFFVDVNNLLYNDHPKVIIPKQDKPIQQGFILQMDVENKYTDIIKKLVSGTPIISEIEKLDSEYIPNEVKELDTLLDISSIENTPLKMDIVKAIMDKCKTQLSKAMSNESVARFKMVNYKDVNNLELISDSTVPVAYNKPGINRKEQTIKLVNGKATLHVK